MKLLGLFKLWPVSAAIEDDKPSIGHGGDDLFARGQGDYDVLPTPDGQCGLTDLAPVRK